jgi:hypothetical protein
MQTLPPSVIPSAAPSECEGKSRDLVFQALAQLFA